MSRFHSDQSFNLMPRLSALHNVMLPMAISGVPSREKPGDVPGAGPRSVVMVMSSLLWRRQW